MSNGTQSIDRAAEVLSFVVRAEAPVSYTEVVEATDLARSTVSRLLHALERGGLLERDAEGGFRGGPLFAEYASRFDRVGSVVAAAQPVLERVGEQTGETVTLGVPGRDSVVHVAQVDSTYLLGTRNWADVEVPPHTSALGKVMFAFGAIPMPTTRLPRHTPHTLTSHAALERELREVRTRGYAVTRGEFEEGLDAVAAPVLTPDGRVLAAISVSGPSLRLAEHHAAYGALLVEESARVAKALARPAGH